MSGGVKASGGAPFRLFSRDAIRVSVLFSRRRVFNVPRVLVLPLGEAPLALGFRRAGTALARSHRGPDDAERTTAVGADRSTRRSRVLRNSEPFTAPLDRHPRADSGSFAPTFES